jgi:hypothetical protein
MAQVHFILYKTLAASVLASSRIGLLPFQENQLEPFFHAYFDAIYTNWITRRDN